MWMRLDFKCFRITYLWKKKIIIEKSINGKGEHVSVDVLEQWAMTDGIFLGYDGKHENSMTAKGDQQSAKWAEY